MPTFRGLFIRKDATRGTTPLEARLSLAGLFTPNGDLGVVPGVLSGLNVAGVSAAWHYAVSAGHVVTTRGATDGATLFGLDGTTDTPTVAAAPASGSRWDLIWVQHRNVDSDADSNAVLGVTEGTPSGTPSKPYGSVPSGALVLAEASVAAGATGTLHANVVITSVTPRTAARGGIIPNPSAAQMTALNSVATAANPIWIDDAGTLKRSIGAGWLTVASLPVDITSGLGPASGWTLDTATGRRQSGHVSIQFIATKATAWVNGDLVMLLPAGSRPLTAFGVGCEQGFGGAVNAAALAIEADGQVVAYGQTGSNKQVRGSIEFNV